MRPWWPQPAVSVRHRRCVTCEVGWCSTETNCWHCRKRGEEGDVLSLRPKERPTPIPWRHVEFTPHDNAALLAADFGRLTA